jgi:hypothetical protein
LPESQIWAKALKVKNLKLIFWFRNLNKKS